MEVRHYSLREVLQRMRSLAAPHRWRLLGALVLMLITAAAVATMPLLPKIIIDEAIVKRSSVIVFVAAGGFLAIGLLRMVAYYFASVILLWVGEDVVFRMRQQGFRHLQRLCLRFHSKYPSGLLYNRVFENAICQIGTFFRTIFTSLAVWSFGLVFALGWCLYLSPPMTAVVLVGAVGYVIAGRRLSPRIHRRARKAMESHNWIAGYILDRLRGTKTIQAFSMEDQVQQDFDSRVWPRQVKWIVAQREVLRLQLWSEGLSYLIAGAIWVMGAHAVLGWGMQLGTLVAFIGYQSQLTSLVAAVTSVYGQSAIARAGFDLYHTVLDTQSTVVDRPDRALPERIRGDLEFRNVTFIYTDRPALRDVSFEVPMGQTVALVGRSGGGKTTVANLLLRFYDPNSGQVLLDGRDIRDLPLRPYRALFGVVLQEPFLFNDTIETNLRCAKPDAAEAGLLEALEKAQALDFVREFPEGLRHRVGEGGGDLSGGQRQRISIARCMLLDPKFLMLDEATSALDNETELLIQKALNALFENRSAFVIAHRLSTIRRADRILVVEQGRIEEDGTFEELLEQGGLFYYLYSIATSTSTRHFKLEEAGFA